MFCEVKYRADERKGSPLEAVDARKQQKIFRTAMYYLTEQQLKMRRADLMWSESRGQRSR